MGDAPVWNWYPNKVQPRARDVREVLLRLEAEDRNVRKHVSETSTSIAQETE